MNDYQAADPGARRRTLLLVLVVSAVGFSLIYWLRSELGALNEMLRQAPPGVDLRDTVADVLLVCGVAIAAPALLMAWGVWRLARRIRASGRYPPPGMAVIKRTEIHTGPRARSSARLLQLTAITLLVFAFAAPWKLWQLYQSLPEGEAVKEAQD